MMMNFINHLEGFVSSKIAVTKGLFTLIKLEAKLAGLNVYPLLIKLSALIALFFSVWLTAMLLLGYSIMLVFGHFLIAIIGVLLVNVGLLIIVLKSLATSLKQMSFEKTRACLSHFQPKDTYELTKRTAGFNSQAGEAIANGENEANKT